MKKYFFALMFMFSFFFVGFTSSEVSAAEGPMNYTINLADSYDNRIVDIVVSNYQGYARSFLITELAKCDVDEQASCQLYERAKNSKLDLSHIYMKVVGEEVRVAIPFDELKGADFTTRYTIQTQSDGEIYILVQCLSGSGAIMAGNDDVYAFGTYKLSTLNQRIVINPDAEGKPTYTYDYIQYTKVRANSVSIELFEDEYSEYNGDVYICEFYNEVDHCHKYTIGKSALNFYISSLNDGEKTINFYLVKKDKTVTDNKFSDANSTLIAKKIVLDETGPKISVEGGQWVFVPAGQKYKEQKATCVDATFTTDSCSVTNDLEIVRINYKTEKYQLITYTAEDRLGNVSNFVVKIKVEIPVDNTDTMVTLLICAGVVAVTFTILGIAVYKNHQKKKKLSYI